jgi:hypothetical protein
VRPDASQERPDWRHEGLGTMIRAGLWLLSEVGEGNIFTKNQLREAFPGISQVDRRLRDLRDYGWVIDTDRSLARLGASEMLFIKAGEPVWEPRRSRSPLRRTLTPQIREKVLARDGFSCTNCGLSAVEGPIEASVKAVLEMAYVIPLTAGGSSELDNLITLCANCHKILGLESVKLPDTDDVWNLMGDLSTQDRTRLLAWIAMDHRPPTPAEKAWSLYRRLRPDQRTALTHRLGQAVIDQAESGMST